MPATEMPEDAVAGDDTPRVHGGCRRLPGLHLCRVIQPWNARVAQTIGAGRRAFGDDQTGSGSLAIVGGHQCIWRVRGRRPVASHRRHHHAIAELQGACRELVEQHRADCDVQGWDDAACATEPPGSVRWDTKRFTANVKRCGFRLSPSCLRQRTERGHRPCHRAA
jgi:hypothetical protein